jgi:hypothetical protein
MPFKTLCQYRDRDFYTHKSAQMQPLLSPDRSNRVLITVASYIGSLQYRRRRTLVIDEAAITVTARTDAGANTDISCKKQRKKSSRDRLYLFSFETCYTVVWFRSRVGTVGPSEPEWQSV